jgi:hypothetical protein
MSRRSGSAEATGQEERRIADDGKELRQTTTSPAPQRTIACVNETKWVEGEAYGLIADLIVGAAAAGTEARWRAKAIESMLPKFEFVPMRTYLTMLPKVRRAPNGRLPRARTGSEQAESCRLRRARPPLRQ